MPFERLLSVIIFVAITGLLSACSTQVMKDDGPGWSLADRPASPPQPSTQVSTQPPTQVPTQASKQAPTQGLPVSDLPSAQRSALGAAQRGPIAPPQAMAIEYKGGRDPRTGKAATEDDAATDPGLAVRKVKATVVAATSTQPKATAPQRAPVTVLEGPRDQTVAPSPDGSIATAIVAKGDTLHGLSLKHRVGLKALMAVNNLTSNKIFPGQKLVLPPSAQ